MPARLRMRQRMTASRLATANVSAGQAYSCRSVYPALRARCRRDFKPAVGLLQMRAFFCIDSLHIPLFSEPRRIFIAVRVFFISIAIVSGPTPPGTGVR
jgi:hypothetical protein